MSRLCKDCEYFHIVQEPLQDHYDSGIAECKRHDLITDFYDHRKFKWLECVEEDK